MDLTGWLRSGKSRLNQENNYFQYISVEQGAGAFFCARPLIFKKPTLYLAVFKGSPQCRVITQQRATNIQSGWSSNFRLIHMF
jgi:hypothetical protein